jgi:hypothetical protein
MTGSMYRVWNLAQKRHFWVVSLNSVYEKATK